MFTETLSIIVKSWKQPRCPSVGEWITMVHPDNGILISAKKEMRYQAMKRHGEALNAYY